MSNRESVLSHALKMIRRNKKSYQRLFFSIFLTFSFLLMMFLIFDTTTFFKERKVLRQPSHIMEASFLNASKEEVARYTANLALTSGIRFYKDRDILLSPPYTVADSVQLIYHMIPKNFEEIVFKYYEGLDTARLSDGGKSFQNSESCYLMEDVLPILRGIGLVKDNHIFLPIPRGKEVLMKSIEVQGSISFPYPDEVWTKKDKKSTDDTLFVLNEGVAQGNIHVWLPEDLIPYGSIHKDLGDKVKEFVSGYSIFVDPKYARDLATMGRQYNIITTGPELQKMSARYNMMLGIDTKRLVGILVFVLLFMNLSASFTNALKDRRYEIALRRSLGASPWRILQEFFLESAIVNFSAFLLSMILVTAIWYGYRLIVYFRSGLRYTVFLTEGDILVYVLMFLSILIFSGIQFAFQAMQTNIVQALQGEQES